MKFEGEEVDDLKVTMRQFKGDIDTALIHGEHVILEVVAKVSEVSHVVNRDGTLSRVHILRVKDVEVMEDVDSS